ncbi:A-kinase anchor protein 1, mitochondrial [Eupeodes corollae]|uniref:A-kinase anchor protein 1, mitochondrial n=1 Tax=Eupeodes corollae TaxID=290404 RepID=UPI002490FA4E|nr:A-kinase anchor protein 1, mitochondrial [Eupeodes corollae]XP_055910155.1 A-kinase anchor protein 1, mitochondrial [Eupeodes corollae]XP_055910156.1 A-kinase anchor protein 1, mitochondrial [Eupeodes corollae]
MVSNHPLLYLPPIAILLTGYFWFRHRNKNSSGDIGKDEKKIESKIEEPQCIVKNNVPKKSASMNINGTINTSEDDDNPATKMFGKSAPIKIKQNNNRPSPSKQLPIDSEVLSTKIQVAENQILRSIDEDYENLSSPVDLPDSVHRRVPFYVRGNSRTKEEPVVIKASASPKISPENSFLESKYTVTSDCEENNNNQSPKSIKSNHSCQSENKTDSGINEPLVEETKLDDDKTELQSDKKRNEDVSSPSLSLSSLQSGDSGKGSSLPRSEANRKKTTYEFFFPCGLVGQLYGRKRNFINQIKAKTSADIVLQKHPFSSKVKICVIEGTEKEINAALVLIRNRLPLKHYPNFTMQRIHFALPQTIVPLATETRLNLQLSLIEGINNDVVVSVVISGGHFFVQQPLHPSHPSLAVLQRCLYDSYNSCEAPMLPGIELNAVCVICVNSVWYRVQIVENDAEDDQRCIVKFLDFGGYMNVHLNDLRQIRADFMGTPFQATECILSNVQPIDTCWSPEAADILCKLTKGIVLQAQVAGYNSHNIPEIYLFACLGPNNVIFINKELVARNLAKWVEIHD